MSEKRKGWFGDYTGHSLAARLGKTKNPIPRRGDIVEKTDFSRMFGRIIGIKGGKKLIVHWNDDEKPTKTLETGKTIALVERRK